MNLFEPKERTYIGVSNKEESDYQFLDRSGHPWDEDIRNYLNEWFLKYPKKESKDLKARLKTEMDSPFFELFLHELFLNLNFSIQVHPDMDKSTSKPDFYINKMDICCYVEARIVTETSYMERKEDRHKNYIINFINSNAYSKEFFVEVKDLDIKSKIKTSLDDFLAKLNSYLDRNNADNFEEIYKTVLGNSRTDEFEYDNDYFYIKLGLIPKKKEFRNEYSKPIIGMTAANVKFMNTPKAIQNGIKEKSGKYGQINRPFIVALNFSTPFGIQFDDVNDALYGSTVYDLTTETNFRKRNGLFGNEDKKLHTRISGILVSNVHHRTIHNSKIRYFKNPYAAYPFSFEGIFDEVVYINQEIIVSEGTPLTEYINAIKIMQAKYA